jgi:hypothetical protein
MKALRYRPVASSLLGVVVVAAALFTYRLGCYGGEWSR